jgi:hypothetical protein
MKWIIVSIIAVILQQFLPWWSIAIAGFAAGFLIDQSFRGAFLNGFLGIFIFWSAVCLYIYIVNDGILTTQLARLMYLPHPLLVIIIPGILGGLTAAVASLSGRYLRVISQWRMPHQYKGY